jgi:hypothetical protein
MNRTRRAGIRRVFAVAGLVWAVGTTSHAHAETGALVVTARKTSGQRPKYTLNSKPMVDLLAALYEVRKQRGAEQLVDVIIDQRLPCEEIFTVTGVAAKAELLNTRVFIASFESGKMIEIKRMPPVPLVVR